MGAVGGQWAGDEGLYGFVDGVRSFMRVGGVGRCVGVLEWGGVSGLLGVVVCVGGGGGGVLVGECVVRCGWLARLRVGGGGEVVGIVGCFVGVGLVLLSCVCGLGIVGGWRLWVLGCL